MVTQLLDAGVPLGKADLLVGTSAGSVGAAHLVDGAPPELLAEILTPPDAEPDPDLAVSDEPFAAIVKRLIMSGGTAAQIRAEFCALALAAAGEPEARLRRQATKFLPTREWPGSGCSSRRSTRGPESSRCSAGTQASRSPKRLRRLDDQLAPVKADGQVVVLAPNEASRAAIGRDQNDLARRAGRHGAGTRAMIDAVAELWHS